MANKFTRFLNGVASSALSPRGMPSTYQHATRLFIDDTFKLSPRTKFNYYVRFRINRQAIKPLNFDVKLDEVGYLVKNLTLPSYQFDSVTKNQYNRKKILYKQIQYQPVNINFHDDASGLINAFWALYYGYYIADRTQPTPAYTATHYRNADSPTDNFRYGLDNDISAPALDGIDIYTMARRRWTGYTLVNPKITQWEHSDMDYSISSEPAENKMRVEYESVVYSGGTVSQGNPPGFATLYYDSLPSPLALAGGGSASLLGEGGVLDGLESVFGNVSDGTAFSSAGGFLNTAFAAANIYTNAKNLSSDDLKAEAIGLITSPEGQQAISGVVGSIFPKNRGTGATTAAAAKPLVNKPSNVPPGTGTVLLPGGLTDSEGSF